MPPLYIPAKGGKTMDIGLFPGVPAGVESEDEDHIVRKRRKAGVEVGADQP